MPLKRPSPQHHLAGLVTTLPLVLPLWAALRSTTLMGFVVALLVGVVVAATAGAALRPSEYVGGAIEGIVAATVFWPTALAIAWAVGPGDPATSALVAGLPAAAASTLALGLLMLDDEVTQGIGIALGVGLVVLAVTTAVPGGPVRHDREAYLAATAHGEHLESLGIQPLIPDLDGYRRTSDDRLSADLATFDDGYSLDFAAVSDDSKATIDIRVDAAGEPDRCEDDCTEHHADLYPWLERHGADGTEVIVTRGGTTLTAVVSGDGAMSLDDIAAALRHARPARWVDVLRVTLD